MFCTKEGVANQIWKTVGEALAEIGFKIDQAKSKYARTQRTGWQHESLKFTDNLAVLGLCGGGVKPDESRRGGCDAGDGSTDSGTHSVGACPCGSLHTDSRKLEALRERCEA